MRKSMNLKAMLEGHPVNEGVALGDDVVIGRDDEDKRKGVVKVPNGPGDTAGVLIDGELEMVPNDEISRERADESEECDDEVCEEGENPFAKKDEEEEEEDEAVLAEGIMGMSMMPSFARMQALAGIRVTESENPFAKKDDEESSDEQEDDQVEANDEAEEVEADDAVEADTETETDDQVEVAVAAETDAIEDEAEAIDDQADAINDQTDAIADQSAATIEIEVDADPALAANHPATAGEVQMMSAPAPVEDFPAAEEAPAEPASLDVCMKALGDLETQLGNVSVKDFAVISKRLQAIQNSLFEGFTGRREKR